MKRGVLERHEDVSDVTGTGEVANFVINDDGRVAVFWPIGVGIWPSLEEMIKVHGHKGKTLAIILDDPEVEEAEHCLGCHAPLSVDHCEFHEACPGCMETVDVSRTRIQLPTNSTC